MSSNTTVSYNLIAIGYLILERLLCKSTIIGSVRLYPNVVLVHMPFEVSFSYQRLGLGRVSHHMSITITSKQIKENSAGLYA